MNKQLKFFLLGWVLLFSLIIPKEAFSRHIIGGHMSYECLGNNGSDALIEYTIEMIRESSGAGAFFDFGIEVGIYYLENNEWKLYRSDNVTLESDEPLMGQLSPYIYQPNPLDYEKGIYRSKINLPKNQGPFMIAYQRCCRLEQSFVNVSGLDSLGTAISTIITPEGLAVCNNSARVEADGQRFFLLNTLSDKIFNIQDQDSITDQLSITLTAPIIAGGLRGSQELPGDLNACDGTNPDPQRCLPPFALMSFSTGYSPTQPFGINSDIIFDPQTNTLRGTPTETGLFQIALQIEEYRNGELLSTSTFEYVMEVIEPIEVALIEARTFFDINKNMQRDTLEPGLDIPISIKEPVLQNLKRGNSFYQASIDQPGTYTYFQTGSPQWKINTADDSIRVVVDSLRAIYQLDIPIVASIDTLIYEASLTARTPLCNDTQQVKITIYNYGTTFLSGSFCLFPDTATSIVGLMDTIFKFEYENIFPTQFRSYVIDLAMPDETRIDELIEHKLIHTVDSLPSDTICWSANLRCSFDPNDKLAFPERSAQIIYPEEDLQYMVRFQNTGNFPAKDVVIIDTLDQNLDLSSLVVTGNSHFYRLRQENNILHFRFLNIYLPDSTSSPEGSQGFISFRIKPKAGLAGGTQILNQAAIYFDRNPPIITNMVERFIAEEEIPQRDQILVYPNPMRDKVFVDFRGFTTAATEIEFYDVQGKYLGQYLLEDGINTILVPRLNAGMHFYRIRTLDGKELQIGKIIKQ